LKLSEEIQALDHVVTDSLDRPTGFSPCLANTVVFMCKKT